MSYRKNRTCSRRQEQKNKRMLAFNNLRDTGFLDSLGVNVMEKLHQESQVDKLQNRVFNENIRVDILINNRILYNQLDVINSLGLCSIDMLKMKTKRYKGQFSYLFFENTWNILNYKNKSKISIRENFKGYCKNKGWTEKILMDDVYIKRIHDVLKCENILTKNNKGLISDLEKTVTLKVRRYTVNWNLNLLKDTNIIKSIWDKYKFVFLRNNLIEIKKKLEKIYKENDEVDVFEKDIYLNDFYGRKLNIKIINHKSVYIRRGSAPISNVIYRAKIKGYNTQKVTKNERFFEERLILLPQLIGKSKSTSKSEEVYFL